MFAQVMPLLSLLILCHAWMTIEVAHLLEVDGEHALAPECYPV
ncbi:hypothetical protein [Ancylobacter sp. G4_0304]